MPSRGRCATTRAETSDDNAQALAVDAQGNVIVTGSIFGPATAADCATVSYDALGALRWDDRYVGTGAQTGYEVGTAVAVSALGDVYVAGRSSANVLTIRYSSGGLRQWVQESAASSSASNSIALDRAGNVLVATSTSELATGGNFLTIKYNSSGMRLWAQEYGRDSAGVDAATAIAVDGDMSVYVTGMSAAAAVPWASDYTTVKYDSAGNQKWVAHYSGPGSNADGATDIAVDTRGTVYVTGVSQAAVGYESATVAYWQGLRIIDPRAGERWIAGEQDTIRWKGRPFGHFAIVEYSADSGKTYSTIAPVVLADSLIWSIPGTELTTRARIRVRDITSNADTAETDTFKVKGYVLTRMTAEGHYERFTSGRHGWKFLNGTLWPQAWWSQFQYSTAVDPYTGDPYPTFFHSLPASGFVDWPLWVEVFSEDACYWSTFFGIYGSRAQNKWKSHHNVHNGSCFGFAASGFLAFAFPDQFHARHQGIPRVDSLFRLNLTNLIQRTINGYYAYQFGRQSLDNDVLGQPKDPRTTLREVRDMFKNDVVDIRTITVYNNSGQGGGAHTMAPIAVVPDNTGPSRYRILLYDSNNPGSDQFYILVDSLNNTWTDFTGLGATWTGASHFYLEIPVSNYLTTPVAGKRAPGPAKSAAGEAYIELYNSSKADMVLMAADGKKIGAARGVITNEIRGAIAIIRQEWKAIRSHLGYYIPEGTYTATMSALADSTGTAFVSVFKDGVVYGYERDGADSHQTDRFGIGDGFSVASSDTATKQVSVQVIVELDDSERSFTLRDVALRQNDSMHVLEVDRRELLVKNYGTQKSYRLELDDRSSQGQQTFEGTPITMAPASSHGL